MLAFLSSLNQSGEFSMTLDQRNCNGIILELHEFEIIKLGIIEKNCFSDKSY